MRTTTTTLLAVTGAALLALTACSSGDNKADTDTPSSTPATPTITPTNTPTPAGAVDLERVVDTYTNLYFAGEGKPAYAFLSKRCKAKADPAVYAATVEQAAKDYGPDHPATDVHATVSGDMGRVSYKVKGLPKFDQEQQPWTREGGTWKYDAC
jgi:ABC-type oligopeptide transport system substrate-binding subunit